MQLAMVGLGRMGMNMARRLLRGGHEVVAYNRSKQKTDTLVKEGAIGAYSLKETVEKLTPPRIIWIMLPAGSTVDEHIHQFKELLSPGDIIVDGGNTNYRDDIQRAGLLSDKKIHFVDAGVSGGIWGLEKGYCLMIGGEKEIFGHLDPIFKTLAPDDGYLYCGAIGSGHFVKMVHNGIEYGMMQAYGEGFQILEASQYSESLDFAAISHLWNQGSVVRSWLLELAEAAFSKDGKLSDIRGYVEDSGEGRWTVQQAIDSGVSAPVIALSLMQRFRSKEKDSFSDKVVAALRREFGGHGVVASDKG
ncbi:MAG: decarboxylating 6-phosphogluconate dehydrogenase [Deltaproteobacteria bacterium]|nr:decarboxylating 6-phosphogluconate dehydrogenase [Deltaproteobacteria bacterium]